MENGKPRLEALLETTASAVTTEIHVHLSRRWLERDPFGRAEELYRRFASSTTLLAEDGVLIYANLRRRKFAIYADEKPLQALGPQFLDKLGKAFAEQLKREKPLVAVERLVSELIQKLPQSAKNS